MMHLASLGSTVSHKTAENTQTYMLYGWIGLDWIGLDGLGWIYLRTLLPLEHIAVLKSTKQLLKLTYTELTLIPFLIIFSH